LEVLVAEDNRVNQRIVQSMLEKAGHRVTLVANGQLAIDALALRAFDVVVMDMQMPVMSGGAAIVEIRKQEHDTGRHLPIVACTAHAMKGDREKCLANGADEYVAKPIARESLLQAIELAVAGPPGRDREPAAASAVGASS
jgi:CheY-like chemotaxis protein